jgi:pimeloyl-ACP methyl ester carboxylesterase
MRNRVHRVVRTKTANVDGLEVVTDGDRGPVILMLHGWPDTRVLWDAQVACAPQKCRPLGSRSLDDALRPLSPLCAIRCLP